MKWPAMGYARVDSLPALWRALDASGPEAQILAGGQSLLATLAFRLSEPSALIDITRIEALKGIELKGRKLTIGALTRHAEIARNPLIRQHAPMMAEAAPLIAHPAIRNRGTIGGSLALADPAAEWPAAMVALGATILTASRQGRRKIPAGDFFQGLFQTALEPGEIISGIEVPITSSANRQRLVEVTRRSGDYAMAGLAASIETGRAGVVKQVRLVFFGIGTAPAIADKASASLVGKPLSAATIAGAQAALDDDLDPPTDLNGSPEMKRHLARVLIGRVFEPAAGNQVS